MSNLYAQSVPIVMHKLANLRHIVSKGAEHAKSHELDQSALTGFRLFPDMADFAAQIRIATDLACGMTHRLSGNDRLSLNDDAHTFDQLLARLDETVAHLESQQPDDYEGSGERQITIKTPMGELDFAAPDYLAHFLFPNLYFHIVTAYNMLRHNGVKLGKLDYMRGAEQ